jgi:hypothetical protein
VASRKGVIAWTFDRRVCISQQPYFQPIPGLAAQINPNRLADTVLSRYEVVCVQLAELLVLLPGLGV